MSEQDIHFVSEIIDNERAFLKCISQEIWEHPEIKFEEIHAHEILTKALEKYGFIVQKHYILPTAFRGEYSSKKGTNTKGPTIAVLCEYDALPNIGHACGHNLIAESGIAAGLAVKAAMEAQTSILGKIVVVGTPGEEGGGGKIKLLENGAFDDIDIALMVHPGPINNAFPNIISLTKVTVSYIGKEQFAFDSLCATENALDAAVTCYTNIAHLKQHIKSTCRINGVIVKGGTSTLVIPGKTQLEFFLRAPKSGELESLKKRVISCFDSAAITTGCKVVKEFLTLEHQNIISNRLLVNLFKEYAKNFGMEYSSRFYKEAVSTDMGNVTHVVPGFHPLYSIGNSLNHTKAFTQQSATDEAQIATLAVSKAMALVAIKIMKSPEMLKNIKDSFQEDILEDLKPS